MFGQSFFLKKAVQGVSEFLGVDEDVAKGLGIATGVVAAIVTADLAGVLGNVGEEIIESTIEDTLTEETVAAGASMGAGSGTIQFSGYGGTTDGCSEFHSSWGGSHSICDCGESYDNHWG